MIILLFESNEKICLRNFHFQYNETKIIHSILKIKMCKSDFRTVRKTNTLNIKLTSTSVAVSESPLSLPSGRSCSSADMQSGSSTDVRDVDFCDGILRRERTLMPDCERGI